MVLQVPEYISNSQKRNLIGMIPWDHAQNRQPVTAQNIQGFRQYTFMQIQKEVEYSGSFVDKREVDFCFKNLVEELREHESYEGVDNMVKYFVRVNMNYQGGSMISGNNLEILHEFEVRIYPDSSPYKAQTPKAVEVKAPTEEEESKSLN
uniref:Uncharacterized protein n=1 Tax=Strombidium rassoulzadegani TaxID=1082188 RepID=A0A7S3FYP5_9SPIT|mmetsp:Transcript_2978/g.5039  ORF Transcript_2978/g.5039 Transcript_2978/m.5039 type:complete len:150 (+) Transcript_2978:417-866(+)